MNYESEIKILYPLICINLYQSNSLDNIREYKNHQKKEYERTWKDLIKKILKRRL